ncbi:tRNA preQ1(34) S-adenosylmethionine ribosyltransferase-isomerase QueA [soil metagenome]
MNAQPFQLSDFDFDLPEELIAQVPSSTRSASRLLEVALGTLQDRRFTDLVELVMPGDLLVFNDTRVIKARLHGRKASGGRLELLIERVIGDRSALVQMRASHPPVIGSSLSFDYKDHERFTANVVDRDGRFFLLQFEQPILDVIDAIGELPLPPYIRHAVADEDLERYQTVYSRTPGAVAAPTAGLHFDEGLMNALRARGVTLGFLTLHVGAGTFLPVQAENLDEHTMHREWYSIGTDLVDQIAAKRARGGRVPAVGTTVLRALESAARTGPVAAGQAETDIFIRPGYRFRVVDRLLTNFHLPRSTLLMLVSAFAGHERMLAAYRHAVQARYRFFSYGDAMLIDPAPDALMPR